MKSFKEFMTEDGVVSAAPTNSVGGIAGTGDQRLSADQRQPGVNRKRKSILMDLYRRKSIK